MTDRAHTIRLAAPEFIARWGAHMAATDDSKSAEEWIEWLREGLTEQIALPTRAWDGPTEPWNG